MKEKTKFKGQPLGILKIENYLIFFLKYYQPREKNNWTGAYFYYRRKF